MVNNNILLWSKENYEKLILGVFVIFLILTGIRMFSGVNKKEELKDFEREIQPPKTSGIQSGEGIYNIDLDAYIKGKSMPYYQPISERAVFFPVEVKGPITPIAPRMSLQCIGIVSKADGVLVATLKNSKTGNLYDVKEGEHAENFIVISISRYVVVLSGEGGQHRLSAPAVQMSFKLTGIMPIESGSKEAMLRNESTKRTYFVKVGDKIENWEVLSISENTVIIFRSDAGKYELKTGGEFKRIQ